MPSEFARNLAQTLEREARVRVGPPTRRGATPRREPKGGDTEKRVVGDGPKRGESRPTDKRVRDGTGQGGGLGEALKLKKQQENLRVTLLRNKQ